MESVLEALSVACPLLVLLFVAIHWTRRRRRRRSAVRSGRKGMPPGKCGVPREDDYDVEFLVELAEREQEALDAAAERNADLRLAGARAGRTDRA
jgi:hypothetical protein